MYFTSMQYKYLAPFVDELTKADNENYYEWLTCPHEMHGNMRRLEVGNKRQSSEIQSLCLEKDRNVHREGQER